MNERSLKIVTEPRLNLLLKVKNGIELLTKTSEELLQEVENQQEGAPEIKLTLKARPRWFYSDYTEPQAVYNQSEIRKVEEQVRYELDGSDLDIAMEIIANLDHRGFFAGNTEAIARHFGVEEVEVEEIRDFIMRHVEPLGVASKNLEEFITLQLEELYPEEKDIHGEVLKVLRRESKNARAKEILASLKLKPFEGGQAPYSGGSVDVVFEYDGKDWYVFVMDDFFEVDQSGAGKVFDFILQMRRRVLHTVGELILRRQAGFMLGKEPLKTLTLGQVAQETGVSISTVSRIVNRKYARTPAGIYPLRFFFLRESKGGLSREEVMRALREILEGEGRGKSDRELSQLLQKRGIRIARRTVNKYRRMIEVGYGKGL